MRIDNQEVRVTKEMSVLEAARQAGISIPTLCHLDALEPFGGCRLCLVEVEERGWTRLVVSCVFPADDKLVVRTRSEKIDRLRKTILELLLAHAPNSERLLELGREYGADANRFQREASFCVHCGLCVRYCAEVKKLDVVGFIDRGVNKEIAFVPKLAADHCNGCKECFPLCPTSYLQAAFVLIEANAFPR
jgi:NADH dehydrogenase/NADH:ubiquinone oxidoreductase subunit G